MAHFSDEEIINKIQSVEERENDIAFKYLYKQNYRMIERFIALNNGNDEDSGDVFQDSLIILYNRVKQKQFDLSCTIKTYLYSVCRNIWLDKLRSNKIHSRILNDNRPFIDVQEDFTALLLNDEKRNRIMDLLNKLGEECRNILYYFYYDRLNMLEIARRMDLSSDQAAKNKKYKCMKKLREMVLTNPVIKKSLMTG